MPSTSTGAISGTVTSATSGLPIATFQVQVFLANGSSVTSVNTDVNGLFTFSGLAPGSYFVRTNGGGNNCRQPIA